MIRLTGERGQDILLAAKAHTPRGILPRRKKSSKSEPTLGNFTGGSMMQLIKRLAKLLILVPVALAIVAIAVANRQTVDVYLDPFAGPSPEGTEITAPLFIVIFISIMVGVVLGSVTTYLEQGTYRRAARRLKGEMESLRAEIARLSLPRAGERKKM
jgi:uncharacterized integral membrane protein